MDIESVVNSQGFKSLHPAVQVTIILAVTAIAICLILALFTDVFNKDEE